MTRPISWIAVLVTGATLAGSPAAAQPPGNRRSVEILSPSRDSTVEHIEDIGGQLHVREGWPVVLIKPPGSDPWWVQPAVDDVDARGNFSCRAYFGRAGRVDAGKKFRIVVVVAPSKAAALKFMPDTTRAALPAGLPQSRPIDVVRK